MPYGTFSGDGAEAGSKNGRWWRALLCARLAVQPRHPGLCHMWIHLHEMSPDPAMALPSQLLDIDRSENKNRFATGVSLRVKV